MTVENTAPTIDNCVWDQTKGVHILTGGDSAPEGEPDIYIEITGATEDARRLRAAWNATASIPVEALEQGVVPVTMLGGGAPEEGERA